MTCPTTLRAALLLATVIHASSSWDASNIWFPDTNNPVFYNMTFYQQAAAQTVVEPTDNLIPATEQPPRFADDRKRPRPPVFNRLPEPVVTRAPVRPVATNRPQVVQRVKKPVRNRQPTTTTSNGRFQGGDAAASSQSDIDRLVVEQQTFIRNEQNRKQFFGSPVRDAAASSQQSGIGRLAAEQQTFIRNEQNGGFGNQGGLTASPPSDNRRHDVFVRNERRRPDVHPDVAVGYKTVPLEETTSAGSTTYYNNNNNNDDYDAASRGLAGNRLRRTKNEGIADGGNYFGRGDYNNNNNNNNGGGRFVTGEQRWNGNRDASASQTRPGARVETTDERSFGRPIQRAVDPAEENRRRWNNAGIGGGDAGIYRVEENVIPDRELPSRPAGPSKCVWAIISCCKPSSPEIRYTCFETLGCHGAFWDTNPCSKEMTMAAVQATANFYNIPRTVD